MHVQNSHGGGGAGTVQWKGLARGSEGTAEALNAAGDLGLLPGGGGSFGLKDEQEELEERTGIAGRGPGVWCGGKRGICGYESSTGEGWACRLGKADLLSGVVGSQGG